MYSAPSALTQTVIGSPACAASDASAHAAPMASSRDAGIRALRFSVDISFTPVRCKPDASRRLRWYETRSEGKTGHGQKGNVWPHSRPTAVSLDRNRPSSPGEVLGGCMNVRSWAAATALSIGAVAGAWSQAISLRPGEYEAVVEFQLPGETQPMVMEHLACVTSVEAADLLKVITEGMAEEDGCEVSNFKQSARTV